VWRTIVRALERGDNISKDTTSSRNTWQELSHLLATQLEIRTTSDGSIENLSTEVHNHMHQSVVHVSSTSVYIRISFRVNTAKEAQ